MKKQRKKRCYVFAAELDKKAARRKGRGAPDDAAATNRRCVYVATVIGERPEKRYPNGDFSAAKKSPLLTRHGRRILPGYGSRHTMREGYLSGREELIKKLKAEGFLVLNRAPKVTYSVYVIELRSTVGDQPSVLKMNPGRNPRKPCVYVGQTSKSPEERFAQHLSGVLSGRHVNKETAVGLMPEVYEHLNPMTELESLRMERNLARKLRKEGWAVLGGH